MSWHWHLYLCFHVLALPPSRGRFMSWPTRHAEPPPNVGRNRWCRLPPRKCAAAAALCLPARTPSFWQCQATVLWDPEGNVPGNVRGDVRHFAWLHPPVPTALVGRNRWCRLQPRKCAAAAALCLHAHRASGNARQLFYGIPKATCPVTSGVTSGILLGCTPHPFRLLLWAEIDGVVCHPGNAPLRLHCAYLHAHRASGNARQLFYGIPNATCQVTSGVTSGILLGCPPRSDCSCGQK